MPTSCRHVGERKKKKNGNRTVNPEVKEKEETIALQPSKDSPPNISDLQGKNDVMKLTKNKPINPVSLEWNIDTAEQLQSSLNCTDWSIFKDTADTFEVDKITEYVGFCVDNVIPSKKDTSVSKLGLSLQVDSYIAIQGGARWLKVYMHLPYPTDELDSRDGNSDDVGLPELTFQVKVTDGVEMCPQDEDDEDVEMPITLQPYKDSPPNIPELQGKNDITKLRKIYPVSLESDNVGLPELTFQVKVTDGVEMCQQDEDDEDRGMPTSSRHVKRRFPTLHRKSGGVEIAINEHFIAIARPSMAGWYTYGNTKSDVNMSNKIRPRKARKHQKWQRARSPLDLQGIDIDEILQQINQEEAYRYSSRTSDTSTLVEKDLNRRDQSLAIAGLQKDSQQQRTVNPEVKEKEETLTLQPYKDSPPNISDLQGKNDITLGKTIQERHYQAVRLAGGAPGDRNRRFVKEKKVTNVDIVKIKNAVTTAICTDRNISLQDVSNNLVKKVALKLETTGHDESIKSLRLYWKSNRGNIREKIKQTLQSNRDEELHPILEDSLNKNNMVYRKTSKRPIEKSHSDNCVTVNKKQQKNTTHYLCRQKMYDRDAQYLHCDEMKGMQNKSNNCWFNSVMQALICIPQLRSLILKYMYDKICYGNVANNEILQIMQSLLLGQEKILLMSEIENAVRAVCYACSFKYNEQQDAFKLISKVIFPFLRAFEMLESFSSKLRVPKTCLSCGFTSYSTHPYYYWEWPVPDATVKIFNIQDIIDNHFKIEEIVAQRCDMCTGKEALLKQEIIQSPELMMIQLLRVHPNNVKINTRVNFKEKVHVKTKTSIASYQLVSVIRHHGKLASSGHYTAKVFNGKGYVIMDDEKCLEELNFVESEESAYIAIYHKN